MKNVVGVIFPYFRDTALCVENKLLLIEHNNGRLLYSEFAGKFSYILNTVIFRQETGESLQLLCDLQMKPQHQHLYNIGNIIQRNSSSSRVIIKHL